jgi:hypothetical protein
VLSQLVLCRKQLCGRYGALQIWLVIMVGGSRCMCWWFRGWFEFAMVGTIWEEEVEVRQEGYTVEMMFMFLYASFYSSRVL